MREHPAAPIPAWIATAVGSVAIIVGTFLPWVASGRVQRHLYQLTGVADRLGFIGAIPTGTLVALPALCALPITLMAVSMVRTGVAAALALSAVAIAVGAAALAAGGGRGAWPVAVTPLGPATVAAGGLFVPLGAIVTIRSRRRVRRRFTARP